MFSTNIINATKEHFDIALWFYLLDDMEIKIFMIGFEWLKNGNFTFICGHEQCKYTMYPSPYIGGVLNR
jgi:hypothetical protein